MQPAESNPPSPASSSTPWSSLPVPVETVRAILSHLDPIKDRTTLSSLALASKNLHEIVFPFLHHSLVLTEWTPASVESLREYLSTNPRIGSSIRYLALPREIYDVEYWTEEWIISNEEEIKRAFLDSFPLGTGCEDPDCDECVEGIDVMGYNLAYQDLREQDDHE